jgi:protein gp37
MTTHKIGWLNMPGYKPETWNPIVGCSKVSPGCDNCYAEKMAFRLLHMPFTDYYAFVMDDNRKGDPEEFRYIPKWNGKTHLVKQALYRPLSWKEPRMIFVCSMSDLFHESTNFSLIDRVFEVMNKCPQHIFILLTKRPENAVNYLISRIGSLSNISKKEDGNTWWGVTAENQEQANKRIPILLQIPATKRIVSIEPMLGPVDLTSLKFGMHKIDCLGGLTSSWNTEFKTNFSTDDFGKLDWVICGGETGPKARPMHPDWVRLLRDQCKAAGTPFFFKQWGKYYTHWANMTTWKDEFKMYESYTQFTQKLWVKKGDVLVDMDGNYPKTGGDMQTAKYPVAIMNPISVKYDILDGQQHHEWPKINL